MKLAPLVLCVVVTSLWPDAGAPLAAQAGPDQRVAQAPSAAAARRPGALSIEEATTLTQGWAFLAQGDYVRAAGKAQDAMARAPRSAAPLVLAVEVEFARVGPAAGLDVYERWLGGRTGEEPAVVRRIAMAMLQDMASQPQNPTARLESLRALADEGDAGARAALAAAASEGGTAETRTLAASGDPAAVRTLLAELASPRPATVAGLVAVGQSRSAQALPVLRARLTETRPEIRGAAAEGLGWLGSAEALALLRPLLKDQSSHVRMKAAAALYRGNDLTGLSILQAAAADAQSPSGQLAAAEAMAVRPDAAWQDLVRRLTQAAAPDIRLSAARLLAPQDPALAASVLQNLSMDPSPAIREEAGRALARDAAYDLAAARLLLRHTDRLTRVYAARSVLRLTR